MKVNPRLNEAVAKAREAKGAPLTEAEAYRIYLAQYLIDRKTGQTDEYEQEELRQLEDVISEALSGALGDDVKKGLAEQIKAAEESEAVKYRTRSAAKKGGTTSGLPSSVAVSTLDHYLYSMSLHEEGEAHLRPFTSTDGLKFDKGGKLYFEGNEAEEISLATLENSRTKEIIENIDLPLLRAFYSIVLQQFERSGYKEVKSNVTLYAPELARFLGLQPNISKNTIDSLLEKVKSFDNIVGVLHSEKNGKQINSYYKVLIFESYDAKKNTITFSSPYMNYLIKTVYNVAIVKDKKGQPKLKSSGEPLRLPVHSYLIDSSIAKEKNKAAVENVFIIIQLIERAGENIPKIRASTIVERNPQLQERLEDSSNKRQLLKRTFAKTWELLRTKTRLTDFYENIVLPDPEDPKYLPTESELENLVITFPHDGKKQVK